MIISVMTQSEKSHDYGMISTVEIQSFKRGDNLLAIKKQPELNHDH